MLVNLMVTRFQLHIISLSECLNMEMIQISWHFQMQFYCFHKIWAWMPQMFGLCCMIWILKQVKIVMKIWQHLFFTLGIETILWYSCHCFYVNPIIFRPMSVCIKWLHSLKQNALLSSIIGTHYLTRARMSPLPDPAEPVVDSLVVVQCLAQVLWMCAYSIILSQTSEDW